jgi:hypothetical protein
MYIEVYSIYTIYRSTNRGEEVKIINTTRSIEEIVLLINIYYSGWVILIEE